MIIGFKDNYHILYLEVSIRKDSRVGKGISAQAAHGTVRESLPSYGSCYPVMLLLPVSSDKTGWDSLSVSPDTF